jgi:uncharacterized delta-60 repeat protein
MRLNIKYLGQKWLVVLFTGFISLGAVAASGDAGTLDNSFQPDPSAQDRYTAIGVQSSGKIVLAFISSTLVRLNPDGSLDESFQPNGKMTGPFSTTLPQLKVLADDKLLLNVANGTVIEGTTNNGVVRLNADGTLDHTFVPGSEGPDPFTLRQSSGKKLVYNGTFPHPGGASTLTRLNVDGSSDPTFQMDLAGFPGNVFGPRSYMDQGVLAATVQTDDKVLVVYDLYTHDFQVSSLLHRPARADESARAKCPRWLLLGFRRGSAGWQGGRHRPVHACRGSRDPRLGPV